MENIFYTDASHNQGLIVCTNKNRYISMSNKLQKGKTGKRLHKMNLYL